MITYIIKPVIPMQHWKTNAGHLCAEQISKAVHLNVGDETPTVCGICRRAKRLPGQRRQRKRLVARKAHLLDLERSPYLCVDNVGQQGYGPQRDVELTSDNDRSKVRQGVGWHGRRLYQEH
jgi:hypothetical protein